MSVLFSLLRVHQRLTQWVQTSDFVSWLSMECELMTWSEHNWEREDWVHCFWSISHFVNHHFTHWITGRAIKARALWVVFICKHWLIWVSSHLKNSSQSNLLNFCFCYLLFLLLCFMIFIIAFDDEAMQSMSLLCASSVSFLVCSIFMLCSIQGWL